MATYTENYNLAKPESSDYYNHQLYDNSNMDIIDEAMKENKSALVSKATDVFNGTVHTITRTNTDSPLFWFVADYKWMDTYTMIVDGTTVTVRTVEGNVPEDEAFILGSRVLCLLDENIVTIFTNKEELDGITDDISNLQTTVDSNTSDISALQSTVATNTSDISTLQPTVATNTSDISSLQTSVSTNTSDINDINTNIESINSNITTINTTLNNVNESVDSIEALLTNGYIAESVNTLSISYDSDTYVYAIINSIRTQLASLAQNLNDGESIEILSIELPFVGSVDSATIEPVRPTNTIIYNNKITASSISIKMVYHYVNPTDLYIYTVRIYTTPEYYRCYISSSTSSASAQVNTTVSSSGTCKIKYRLWKQL